MKLFWKIRENWRSIMSYLITFGVLFGLLFMLIALIVNDIQNM